MKIKLSKVIKYPMKNEMPLNDFEIVFDYIPGTKKNVKNWCIKYKGVIIKKKETDTYGFFYKCNNCFRENGPVKLFTIKRRIIQKRKLCLLCQNTDIDKINSQKEAWTREKREPEKKLKNKTANEIIFESVSEFQKENEEFRHAYNSKHITMEEFEMIKNKIVSFQKGRFKNIKRFIYLPYIKVNNVVKYIPRFYDTLTDKFEKIEYICWKCDICETAFTNRDWTIQKDNSNILCLDCNFTNKIFRKKPMKTFEGKMVHYQSKPEKSFIEFCNKNKISIENGPKIPYRWNNRDRRYEIDFYLPEKKIWLEIKGKHYWHKENLKNGKWTAKENAAKKNLQKGYSFNLVYTENLPFYKESLLRYSLTSWETMRNQNKESDDNK